MVFLESVLLFSGQTCHHGRVRPPTVDVLQHNVREVEGESICTVINSRVNGHPIELDKPVDMAIMNPPWGVQTLRADRDF